MTNRRTAPPPEWVVRIRWTRDHWAKEGNSPRWNLRLFQSAPHAAAWALKMAESGARVEWTCWKVDQSRRVGPREDLEPLLDYLERRGRSHHRERSRFQDRPQPSTPPEVDRFSLRLGKTAESDSE
jgi:hypothetical protein